MTFGVRCSVNGFLTPGSTSSSSDIGCAIATDAVPRTVMIAQTSAILIVRIAQLQIGFAAFAWLGASLNVPG
jgi:hypothetical protein